MHGAVVIRNLKRVLIAGALMIWLGCFGAAQIGGRSGPLALYRDGSYSNSFCVSDLALSDRSDCSCFQRAMRRE